MERKLWSAVSIPMYSFIDVAQNPQNSRASWSLLSSQVCWWQETTKRFIRMDNSGEIRWDSKKLLHTSWQEFWWRRGTWKFQRQQKASGFWDCFFLVEGPSKRWEVHEHGQRKCRFVVDDLWKIHNGFPFHPSLCFHITSINPKFDFPPGGCWAGHLQTAAPGTRCAPGKWKFPRSRRRASPRRSRSPWHYPPRPLQTTRRSPKPNEPRSLKKQLSASGPIWPIQKCGNTLNPNAGFTITIITFWVVSITQHFSLQRIGLPFPQYPSRPRFR